MSTEELKPCPFCGSDNLSRTACVITYGDTGDIAGNRDVISCLNCYTMAPLDLWNRRADNATYCKTCVNWDVKQNLLTAECYECKRYWADMYEERK